MPSRSRRAILILSLAGVLGLGGPAVAVNENHGSRVVSADPADPVPHAMEGSVDAITRIGNTMIAAGSFRTVSPAGTYGDTSDDLVRRGIFAFDATTGAIDRSFDPRLGGGDPTVNSLDTDGEHIYVGGKFRSVAGDDSIQQLVKLTREGAVVRSFRAVPDERVTEVVVRGPRLYVAGPFTSVTSRSRTWPRRSLAALNPATGAVRGSVNLPFTGIYNPDSVGGGGSTSIVRFDVTADGSRLVAVGNFAKVAGKPRAQVAVLNTPARRRATVAAWRTNRFHVDRSRCRPGFNTFLRDVDFSPNGSYFVVTTTGAFSGGARLGVLCDTVSRWETSGGWSNPTWVDYTGGDTTYGVAATGSAVYVGGHQRWFNNPFRGDRPGPGAVPREGIAALDPVNGLPLSWNPGRTKGVGAQALLATRSGVWVGSDTTSIGGERHGRVAFMPLAGGSTVPASPRATLPADLFAAVPRATGGILERRPADRGGRRAGRRSEANAEMDWSQVRGAFVLGNTLTYGWADGSLHQRGFDARTGALGSPAEVNLRAAPDDGVAIPFPIARVSGMFFHPATHRLYYTVRGARGLFYRYYTPESAVVGAQTFRAGTNGVSFARARGLTLASGKLLYGSMSGKLRRVRFFGGRVRSKPTVVDRPTWNVRAILTPTR